MPVLLNDKRNTPRWMIFLIDLTLAAASVGFAYLLRFSFTVPPEWRETIPNVLLVVLIIRAVSFILARTYSGIIRYTGTQDLIRIFLVNLSGSVAFSIINLILSKGLGQPHLIPFNVVIIDFLLLTLAMASYRMLVKMAFIELNYPTRRKSDVVIFGAGETGLMAKRAIEGERGNKYKVSAFIDDNPSKHRKKLDNVIILPFQKLGDLLKEQQIEQVVIAVPGISPVRRSEIVEVCLASDVKVMSVPPVARWIDGELSYRQLQKVKIEDLLGRDEIVINTDKIRSEIRDNTIMVTGAAGSIGSELVRQIAGFKPATIILLDQAETPLYEIENELNGTFPGTKTIYLLADITDRSRMQRIFRKYKPRIIYHAAAYKHVPMMEGNPREAVRTNVLGTKIMADLAHETGVEKFVMISTDKAVNPTSVMGASKRMAEIYTQTLNGQSSTRFITTRFGNVLGSNGSVIQLFRRQIENGGPVTITHPQVTRYFMTIPEASRLVLEAASMGGGGEIFLFDMGESVKIIDLAKKMIRLSGKNPGTDIQIVYTGLRPGEKLFEELLTSGENTIHTGNPHILAAKVRDYNWAEVTDAISELLQNMQESDTYEVVRCLKKIIPEYVSQNSLFEQLDQPDLQ
ncbi:MAG TPA: nucleoside-diphosphate sugar epimerase/dehydratase [Bacteroidales bacterium]|nr:nucleoside-diphosphate sugar epimerase/dehydratase [Bacteroidales bacterium]HRZ49045.1 nucleoside-diphosphate sugar epimerase/dehydratase [Bacteroidales bacterium]